CSVGNDHSLVRLRPGGPGLDQGRNRTRVDRVERAGGIISQPVEVDLRQRPGHKMPPCPPVLDDPTPPDCAGFPSATRRWPSSTANRARPRAHRLFTVPSATPSIAAISETEYPSTSSSTIAARCSAGI